MSDNSSNKSDFKKMTKAEMDEYFKQLPQKKKELIMKAVYAVVEQVRAERDLKKGKKPN